MAECLDKNMIDKDEYPQTAEIETRCVNILSTSVARARRRRRRPAVRRPGRAKRRCSAGSHSSAAGSIARAAEGKSAEKPNLVMGINVQVCWEKFANYWDVEMRLVPMEGDRFHLSAEEAVKRLRREHDRCRRDSRLDVRRLLRAGRGDLRGARRSYEKDTGLDVPVHVDGASGRACRAVRRPGSDVGLPAAAGRARSTPRATNTAWCTRASAGSCGVTRTSLPEELIFWVNYLGDNMPTFALNFSRPGAQVVAQYYNFLRLGFDGYAAVQGYARDVATRLAAEIEKLGPFELLTRGDALPVFAFKLTDEIDNYTVFDLSNALRARGWQLPAYTFPKNRTDLAALRVVVRRGVTHDLSDLLISDIKRELGVLSKQAAAVHTSENSTSFHH